MSSNTYGHFARAAAASERASASASASFAASAALSFVAGGGGGGGEIDVTLLDSDGDNDDDGDDDDDDGPDGGNAVDDDDDELDEDAAAASAFMGDDDDDDDGGENATNGGDGAKKSLVARDGPLPWAGTTRDYTYDELVDRIFGILSADRPDLAGGARKKYQMKPPKVERDGTKKTLWANFPEMCRTMHRLPDHVYSYVFAELGTTGSVDGTGRLVIKGRFQPKQIEKVVRHYIAEYVSCRTCRSPDTRLVKENRLQFIHCQTCGSRRTVSTIRKGFEAQIGKRKNTRLAAEAAQQRKPGAAVPTK
jgi:translation initiation factor 2 subunit 2